MIGRDVVSTAAPEFASTLTPDGDELYFTRSSDDRSRLTIMVSRRLGEAWAVPHIAPFSGVYRDVDPFVAPDGRRLFFSSDRPRSGRANGEFATWYVERTAAGWSAPVDPGPPLNSTTGDVYFSIARDGTAVFSSSRDGRPRVYTSRAVEGHWSTPVPVDFGGVSDGGNPAIAPSGRWMLIVRVQDGQSADLFRSCRVPGGWGVAEALSGLNSAQADFAPFVEVNERWIYFTSERPGVVGPPRAGARPPGDVYRVPVAEAGIECP